MRFHDLLGLVLTGCLIAACDGGGGTGGGGGSGGQPACSTPEDCPAPTADCEVATCEAGACGIAAAPDGTPATAQTPGDCKKAVCQSGAPTPENDDADVPDEAGDCTVDACDAGSPATTPEPLGTPCTADAGKVCDATGQCVGCNSTADCEDTAAPACDAAAHLCVALSCMDADKNGDETDVDCGGSCAPCDDAEACLLPADCKSGVCTAGVCQAPTCEDAVKNGAETGADCGGGQCPPCGPDEGCDTNEDCVGAECSGPGGTCTPNCQDQAKNNAETDIDCGGGACPQCAVDQGCLQDTDCAGEAFCDAATGACALKKDLGLACAGANECLSTRCVDAVCCNATCGFFCQSCNLPGTAGTCTPMAAGTDPEDECAGNGGSDVCNGGLTCGKGPGAPCGAGSECGSGHCVEGLCCDTACSGACQSCLAAKTGGTDGACAGLPAGTDPENECPGSITCSGMGACSPKLANGVACALSGECQSGFCVDGVCCTSTCANACRACDNAGFLGTCTFIAAGTDPDNECAGAATCNGSGACN